MITVDKNEKFEKLYAKIKGSKFIQGFIVQYYEKFYMHRFIFLVKMRKKLKFDFFS